MLLLYISLCLLSCQTTAKYITDDRFMSDVNLEHYYIVEENVMSNADVLLRDDYFGADVQEDEEEHLAHMPNLTSFKSIVEETKNVHRLAGPDLDSYLAHPVNVFHLFRRLGHGWKDVIDTMLDAKPCKHWNVPVMVGRLRYLKGTLPGDSETKRVVDHIANLQKIHHLSVKDISDGHIGDADSLQPLNAKDQFQIAKMLHENEDMQIALKWLNNLADWLNSADDSQKSGLGFKHTDILNMAASAHYYMRNLEGAMKVTEKVVEIEPTNDVAKFNLHFFKTKLEKAKESEQEEGKRVLPKKQKLSLYQRLCARKTPKKLSRKKCKLERLGLTFYKVEILRRKPEVVLFHDVIGENTTDILKNYAKETQTEKAWISDETFNAPNIHLELSFKKIRLRTVRNALRHLKNIMKDLLVFNSMKEAHVTNVQILNSGLEGVHLKRHASYIQMFPFMDTYYGRNVASYLFFLNEVKTGGEVVLEKERITVKPSKGSVLVYFPSKSGPNSFCPVVGGSLWVGLKSVYEEKPQVCFQDEE